MITRAPTSPGAPQTELVPEPQTASRSEVIRRFQIGAIGIIGVLLLIGLASIIEDRAQQSDSTAVAEAVPVTSETATPAVSDPLAQAGVLPDMPASAPSGTGTAPAATASTANGR